MFKLKSFIKAGIVVTVNKVQAKDRILFADPKDHSKGYQAGYVTYFEKPGEFVDVGVNGSDSVANLQSSFLAYGFATKNQPTRSEISSALRKAVEICERSDKDKNLALAVENSLLMEEIQGMLKSK